MTGRVEQVRVPAKGELWIGYGEMVSLDREIRPGVWSVRWVGTNSGTIWDFDSRSWVRCAEGARCVLLGLLVEMGDVYADGLDLFVVKDGEPDIDLAFSIDQTYFHLLLPAPAPICSYEGPS